MSNEKESLVSRRDFVRHGGLLAGGALLGPGPLRAAWGAGEELPRRVLGRTNVPVTTLTLGTAPMGLSDKIPPPQIAKVVSAALDLGITSVDTAPTYIQAEEGVGMALGRRRKGIFLATKVAADTIKDAEKSLANSLRLLKTDAVDLLYYHSVGNRKVEGAMDPGGVFNWLVAQKKAGKCRFLGVSGHNTPDRFIPFLKSDEVDVILTVVNFVDRHTYGFEEKVLPLARKHNAGIVAMKVFGGAAKKAGSYAKVDCPPEIAQKHLQSSVRYALGTSGVATVNLGVHSQWQVRKNFQMVKNFAPLSPQEAENLDKLGRKLAAEWGPHFGPVA